MQKNSTILEKTYSTWQQQLAESFTTVADLCRFLHLSTADLPVSQQAAKDFPLRVPLSYAKLMEKANPDDPLLLQVLPVEAEQRDYPGYHTDPVGDLNAACETGVLHKYFGRVLFITTGGCAINCRYCFRRNFPYNEHQLSKQKQTAAITYLKNHAEISEIILSGGDPLLLNDRRLADLMLQIRAIPHIQRIRIHSRIPVVLPSRISDDLIAVLLQSGKQIIMVLHSNHAKEISPQVASACFKMKQNQITLLNQSVLLKRINDDAEQLTELSNRLFAAGVLPYYLHLLDKAKGTGHFEVAENVAVNIMQQLQQMLPGYLVPKLVKEQAGALSKLPVIV